MEAQEAIDHITAKGFIPALGGSVPAVGAIRGWWSPIMDTREEIHLFLHVPEGGAAYLEVDHVNADNETVSHVVCHSLGQFEMTLMYIALGRDRQDDWMDALRCAFLKD